ncbi:potassium channel family protein [Marinilactibacillus sp. Marseille-P9653]|uniref:potassium channel family protein n=1 Tax=Marinilactibacillus sp. Marseille-P9653 TaxID=2866583 RepID=UPI001CE4A1F0|nr:potassium channel family protein [Marinilactibacillus sp. Marseille-P9653]
MTLLKKYYDPVIIVLALFSVCLVVLDILSVLNLTHSPFKEIDRIILSLFALDYFGRFFASKNKVTFFNSNLFDLIAIIPLNSVFAMFRLARLFRITRLTRISRLGRFSRMMRLTRMIGLIGKATRHLKRFFNTNGFSYMLYAGGIMLLIGAFVYSITENVSFIDALWWAFVTSTTVGYGDISPTTPFGRLAAMMLMLTGIGLFGALTSIITSFFMNTNEEEVIDQSKAIQELNDKISLLLVKMDQLEDKNHPS